MPLIVETGQGVEDADSYVSLADARTISSNYGWSLPADDALAEIALRNGAMYTDQFESEYQGDRTTEIQGLAFPRTGVTCRGKDIGDNDIPKDLIKAQVRAASTAASEDINPDFDGKQIASERVDGAVDVSYFQTGGNGSIKITQADNLLKCFKSLNKLGFNQFLVSRG